VLVLAGTQPIRISKSYTYGNDQWNDLLTEYNGGKIAYEGQTYSERLTIPEGLVGSVSGTAVSGNPISYYNGSRWTLEWEHGRNLTRSLFVSSNTPLISENKVDVENDLTYTYDADGIRTGRTYAVRIYRYAKNGDNGSVVASVGELETNATYSRYLVSSSITYHKYITQNGKVVRETIIKGGVTRVLDYIYDESGRPSSLIYTNGSAAPVTYYYVLNLQGDVEKIIDANGVVQAIYSYDPWGKILSITSGTGASVNDTHIAKLNGLRYRGYHGDNETQWYYLQSRYYDPFTRRFVNADSITYTGQGILGANMFAYCGNNPVAYEDSSGNYYRPAVEAVNDGGTCVNVIETDGSERSEELANYLHLSHIAPLPNSGVPYVKATIKAKEKQYWEEDPWYYEAIPLVAEYALSKIDNPVAAAIGEIAFWWNLTDLLFIPDAWEPNIGYHDAYDVTVTIYYNNDLFTGYETKRYTFYWCENSPIEKFWYAVEVNN